MNFGAPRRTLRRVRHQESTVLNWLYLAFQIHQVIDGLFFRILAMILVIVDVVMVVLSVTEETSANSTAHSIVSIFIVTYFLLELFLR